MPNITTMMYDSGGEPLIGVASVRTVAITIFYDSSCVQRKPVNLRAVAATCTYVNCRYWDLGDRPDCEGTPLASLLATLSNLLTNAPRTGQPLWWHVWNTLSENPWLHLQQVTIARRFVRRTDDIEEMCQVSTIHLGQLLERCPWLGLSRDEVPSKFARRIRRIIRRDFITWLRRRSRERRRMMAWSAEIGQSQALTLLDRLEIAAAMAQLPGLHREIVQMRAFGCQRLEIAKMLNLSVYQVDRIFASCRKHLRRRLKDFRPDRTSECDKFGDLE